MPTCTPGQCNNIKPPGNGTLGHCPASLNTGEHCLPACNAGYALNGKTTCSFGVLSSATCEVILCDASVAPFHGGVGNCTRSLGHGEICQPSCDSGYMLTGTSSCNSGVLVSASCSGMPCDTTSLGSKAGDCPDSLADTASCQPICNLGWIPITKATCTLGKLSEITCVPMNCSNVEAPRFGKLGNCKSTLAHNTQCEPVCNAGYTASAPTACRFGKIIPTICNPRVCDSSKAPAHGTVGDCPPRLLTGETCKPECDMGYVLNGVTSCNAGSLSAAECVTQ